MIAEEAIPTEPTRRKVKYGEARAKRQLVRALFFAPTKDARRSTATLLWMKWRGIVK